MSLSKFCVKAFDVQAPKDVQHAIVDHRVQTITRKYLDGSLTNQGAKGKKQFSRLSKSERREWREALQRNINALKSRLAARVLSGVRPKGKTAYRWQTLTKLEEALIDDIREAKEQNLEFQGFGDLAARSAVTLAACGVAGAAFKTANVMGDVSKLVEGTTPDIKSTANGLNSFVESLNKFVESIKHWGEFLWKPVLVGLGVWLLTKYAHVSILIAAVTATITLYVPEIKSLLEKYLPGAIQTQDGVSMTADLIAMMCTCWVPGRDTKSVTGEFMKRASNFPKASDGIESFLKKILSLIEDFLNFILRKNDEDRLSLTGKLNAFDAWRKEAIEAITHMAKNPKVPIEDIRKVKDIQVRGLGFHQILATLESKRELNYWLEKLALALAPHEGAINAENNMRAMPSCIMIGGDSGVGKTTMIRYIASMVLVLSRECTLSDALDNLWQKGSTEYWNGYIGQKCLVMDDCFQVKGKPGDMDSEAMQMIRGIGNWSYPLNFADLASKGKIYLDSPLVIGTTNCKNVEAEWAPFITQPKALTRRFQTSCWVTLNPEYRDEHGRFDYVRVNRLFHDLIAELSNRAAAMKTQGKKITVDEVLDSMPWDIWMLHPHDFDRENVTDAVMPGGLRTVVETTAKQIRMRKQANREEIKDISSLLQVLTDAMELEPQSGIAALAKSTGISSHATLPYGDDLEIEPMAQSSGSDTPNLERIEEHRAAMDAERQHTSIFDTILEKFRGWQKQVEIAMSGLGLLGPIIVGLAAGAWLLLVFKILSSIVIAAVNVMMIVVQHVLGLFGVKAKPTPKDEVREKHMRIPTYNSLGQLQVGVPPNESIYENIFCNTLKCTVGDMDVGQFIGLGSDVYIFPKHFIRSLRKLNPLDTLSFVSAKDSARGTMSIADFLELRMIEVPDYDIAGVSFGRGFMKAAKHILPYFLAQHEIKNILRGSNNAVRLDVAIVRKNGLIKQNTMFSPTCAYHGKAIVGDGHDSLDGLVRYSAPTEPGDCGAPLTLSENRYYGGRCILGFHSAGRDNMHGREGYSTIVSQELAREIFMQLHTYHEVQTSGGRTGVRELFGPERVQTQDALNAQGVTGGSFELIGILEEPVNVPTKTALKKSTLGRDELFGPCPVAPAVLRATEVEGSLRDPMIEGLRAYQTDLEYKNPAMLEPVVTLAMQKHWEATQHHPRCVLTFEEAIVGPEGWKIKPINRKTSPGYRYRKYVTGNTPGKTAFFGHEGDYTLDPTNNKALTQLREDVDIIVTSARKDIRELHLCTDFLKDELRPLVKVENVATRVISGTPLDYTIAVRMYFGAYLAAMFDTYVDNGMAPGINQYTQWFKLVSALKSKGDKLFDGDFKRYDASEQPWVHEAILKYVNKWYQYNNPSWSAEDDKVRCVLWLDLVHSRHISGCGSTLQYVVQWTKSLPSGHPLTTMVNSMYSLITLTGCYMSLTNDRTDMWKHAYIVTFGDDNISSVDDTVCDAFNQVTVEAAMRELFGLTYTPGNKSGVLVPYTTIENVTFLKRSFRVDDSIGNRLLKTCAQPLGWVGPLDFSSFLYVPYWYKNSRTATAEMVTRIEQMLCELSLHTQDDWDSYHPKIMKWCSDNGVPLQYTSREQTRAFVAQRMDVWF